MSLKVKERRRARFHAIQALYQREMAGSNFTELKAQYYVDNQDRHPVEWDFFYRLMDGVAAMQPTIDEKINGLALHKIESITPIELSIMRLGVYELLDCLEIPYQVIVNEYVDQASSLGTEEGHRFVNGMLDKLAKKLRK